MDLSRITIATRPRTPWESVDLGFAMARHWFLPLWLCWWLTAAPLALAALALLHAQPSLWLLLIWWCKPAFEALPLYWLSRVLFGEPLRLGQAARQLPQALPARLWPQLLWRRIGMTRAFSMPVTLLEAPRGAGRGARLRVLKNGAAGWLTVVCVHLEAVLWLSSLLLLAFMLPRGVPTPDLAPSLMQSGSALSWISSACMLLAASVIAPFYVAAGFALYLGRRTQLEAWDLELAFRRARERRAASTRPLAAALMLAAVVAVQVPGPAAALTRAEAQARIDAVLADPDFGTTREEYVWVYAGDADTADDDPGEPLVLPAWLIEALAKGLKWVLLLAAAVALGLIALRLVRELDALQLRARRTPKAAPARAETLAAAAVPARLPTDVPSAVRDLLAAGDARSALALLYRDEITRLRAAGLTLPESTTEAECLRAATDQAGAAELAWLRRLLHLWQQVAYGHRPPDAAAVLALLTTRSASADGLASHG